MYFSKKALCNIPVSISTPRFSTYLDVATSDLEAIKLYQWNVELSSAYYIPMHFYEIILRNTVSEAIKLNYGSDWHRNENFRLSLDFNNRRNLASAIRNAKRTHNTDRPTIGAVIAESKFVFWGKMFTSRHDSRIWENYFEIVFPMSDNSLAIREKRGFIYSVTEETRKLRNRIAHHEPIFDSNRFNHGEIISNIEKIIAWRCCESSKWVRKRNKVSSKLLKHPII